MNLFKLESKSFLDKLRGFLLQNLHSFDVVLSNTLDYLSASLLVDHFVFFYYFEKLFFYGFAVSMELPATLGAPVLFLLYNIFGCAECTIRVLYRPKLTLQGSIVVGF